MMLFFASNILWDGLVDERRQNCHYSYTLSSPKVKNRTVPVDGHLLGSVQRLESICKQLPAPHMDTCSSSERGGFGPAMELEVLSTAVCKKLIKVHN